MEETKARPRVAFHTMGCRSNFADTVDLQALVFEHGHTPCGFDSKADTYVLNTCTVTDSADKEARKIINKIRQRSPEARIILTGCMAEVKDKELLAIDGVHAVIGPGRKSELIAEIIGEVQRDLPGEDLGGRSSERGVKERRSRRSISLEDPMPRLIPGPGGLIGETPSRMRYHLRVQEGCENSCTFCIIPQTRGALSSRPLARIRADIEQLHSAGYREIVLTGTHLGGYGEDSGESLFSLLSMLDQESPIRRIRLSSLDPNNLNTEIIDLISRSNAFCPHLHICVQAFSDKTLKRMNRRYRLEDAEEILCYTRERFMGCCIGSDVITGFPGESRQELDEGIETFLRLPISYLHVFPYSEREHTAAVRLDGSVEIAERKRRAARWRSESERKELEYLSTLLGNTLDVIVEEVTPDSFSGTSREFAHAESNLHQASEKIRLGTEVRLKANSLDLLQRRVLCESLSPVS